MKKLFSLSFALLMVANMQAMSFPSVPYVHDIEEEKKSSIERTIKTYGGQDALTQGLQEYRNMLDEDYTFYTKTKKTLSEEDKKKKVARIFNDTIEKKGAWEQQLKIAKRNVPDHLKKAKKDVKNQKILSFGMGLAGFVAFLAAASVSWVAIDPSLTKEVFSGGVLAGGLLCIWNAVTLNLSADKELKKAEETKKKAEKNLPAMQKVLGAFNFFENVDPEILQKAKQFAQEQTEALKESTNAKDNFYTNGANWFEAHTKQQENQE